MSGIIAINKSIWEFTNKHGAIRRIVHVELDTDHSINIKYQGHVHYREFLKENIKSPYSIRKVVKRTYSSELKRNDEFISVYKVPGDGLFGMRAIVPLEESRYGYVVETSYAPLVNLITALLCYPVSSETLSLTIDGKTSYHSCDSDSLLIMALTYA